MGSPRREIDAKNPHDSNKQCGITRDFDQRLIEGGKVIFEDTDESADFGVTTRRDLV
jgi:hypothetical protein